MPKGTVYTKNIQKPMIVTRYLCKSRHKKHHSSKMFKICDSKEAAKTPTTLQLSDAPASQSHKCPKFRSHVDSPPPEHESCSAYLTLAKGTELLKRTSLNHI